jgi:hypothetical protein
MKYASSEDDKPQLVEVSSDEAPAMLKKTAGVSRAKGGPDPKVAAMFGKVNLEVFE